MSAGATRRHRHVGIVGCSAEGASLCYATLCTQGATLFGRHAHPEVSMHTPSLDAYVGCLERADMQGVAALMLDSAAKLAAAGADLLVCPDNTIHQAMPWVTPSSPLPWLHIVEVVADEAQRRGFRRLGVLGTRWLLDSDLYPNLLGARGIEVEQPGAADRERLGAVIMDELVYGEFKRESIAFHQSLVDEFRARGCDAVVLGCTEIPLILGDHNASLPTLDSTRLLAHAALRAAYDEGARAGAR